MKKKWIILAVLLCVVSGIGLESNWGNRAVKLIDTVYHRIKEESYPESEIDFNYWKEINPDVYAWIRVEGTRIDYPILQSEVDGYYLDHDIEKEPNIYGAIYTEARNQKDFNDIHTVIYGHNMRDNSMFGSLKEFADPEFLEEHDRITIFLPGETRQYQIIAAYQYPAIHLLNNFDFTSDKAMMEYCKAIPEYVQNTGGYLRKEVSIQAPLITLSTCTSNDENMRFLVQGVLIEKSTNE